MAEAKIHVFERAGLGAAPYKYLGMEKRTFQAAPGAPLQPGTCCDYCHTGIHYVFHLRSGDGKRFKVGSDCILKSGDAGLKRAISDDRKQLEAARTAARLERERQRIAAARDGLSDTAVRAALGAKPHPHPGLAQNGKTFLDYVEWSLNNAGHSGRLNAARIVERYAQENVGTSEPAAGMQVMLGLLDAPAAARER